ncbi:peroxisomal membrane anchor protein conserved region-domain-containing protein [Xylaria digitata]|nr:peroxisomal membrane anchor protein conserved region-domain-containing protein [Xylaria digitata]
MDDPKKSSIPAWQQATADADANADADATVPEPEKVTIEHARRFLNDETVKAAAPEEKRKFLKSKGLEDDVINQLLEESREEDQQHPAPGPATETLATSSDDVEHKTDAQLETEETVSTPADDSSSTVSSTADIYSPPASSTADSRPPIITYPEFLTKPQRPPPLITPSRLANIIAVSGGVWALIYGISGLVIKPMADNLNEARSEYYSHVNGKLSQLVEKLEGTASEVPYKNGKPLKSQYQDRTIDDNESVISDPTELFHRDVGTQTSSPPSIVGINASNNSKKPVDIQADKLSAISVSLRELTLMHTQRAESNADLRSAIGEIRDQVDKLAYPAIHDFSTYGGLGYGQSAEADDEFKKTKDAIRSIKGLFLSSRSFPAVVTR